MNLQDVINSIEKFNLVAGCLTTNNDEQTLDGIELQLSLIDEELQEGYNAFAEQDATELADAVADIFVVATGLVLRLNAAGYNMPKIMQRVADNNMAKYIDTYDYNKEPEKYLPENAKAFETPYGYTVFKRDSDLKIVKPKGFVKVGLDGCVPEDFFGSNDVISFGDATFNTTTGDLTFTGSFKQGE